MNLFEINDAIMNCVDEETGEVVDIQKFEELQMSFGEKVENIGLWIKNLTSDADAIKAEEKNLADRRKSCENKAKSLKSYLEHALDGATFKTPKLAISYRKSESLEIADGAKIPEMYLKYAEPTVDKMALKKAVKAGAEFDGVSIVQNQNMQIK